MADGTVVINTDLDPSGIAKGLGKLPSMVKAGIAALGISKIAGEIEQLGESAIAVGSSFEAGMSNVSAISGATGADLEALSDKAKEMGAKTKFSATEAADAFQYMAMAGWKTSDMLDGIEGIMNLAAASGEDLATTSDIVTDALTAFGLKASDSAHFADVLAKAASSSNTNVGLMGETFKYVAPVAGALKFSAEDCAVAIGLMANSGIKASQAGTSLRQLFTNLAKPTDNIRIAMDKLGISLTDSAGNVKTLDDLTGNLRQSFSGLTEAEKAQYAATLAGQEGMSGLLAIVNASDDDFNALKGSIYNAEGAAKSMADTMQNNLKGKVTILKSSLEGLGIQIYESMEAPLKKAADKGTEYVGRISKAFSSGGLKKAVGEAAKIFDELTDKAASSSDELNGIITPMKNVAKAGLDLGKSALPVVVSALGSAAKNLDKLVPMFVAGTTAVKTYNIVTGLMAEKTGIAAVAQAALNAVMNANPVGLLVGAVGALAAGLGVYAMVTDGASESTRKLLEDQKETLKSCNEVTQAMNEEYESRQANVFSIDQEYTRYGALISELEAITDENGRVKAGYEERAAVITGELSNALGIEIEMIDGVIQNNQELIDTIKEVIVQKKAEALLSSMQEEMSNAYEKTTQAMEAYKDASAVLEDANKAVKDATAEADAAQQRYEASLLTGGEAAQQFSLEYAQAKEKLEAATEVQKEAKSVLDENKTAMSELSAEVNNYNALMDAMASGETEKIQAAMTALVTSYRDYSEEFLRVSEENRQEMYDQANNFVENMKLVQDGTLEVADSVYQDMSKAALDSILEFNKVPGGVGKALAEIGPEGSAAIASALAGADLSGQLDGEAKKGIETFISGLSGLDEETKAVWSQAWYGALEGLAGFEMLKDPAVEGADAFLESLKDALEVHSPSQAVREIFSNVWPGASEGFDQGKEGLAEKGNSVITEFLTSLSSGGFLEGAQQVGANIMSFFGIGVSSQTASSMAAGKGNADAANTGAGSVNPTGTGSKFGTLLSGGITAMSKLLQGAGLGIGKSADAGAASVNPVGTGNKFGTMLGSGISAMAGLLNNSGTTIAKSADSGAGSVNPTGTGQKFGSQYSSGVASETGNAGSQGRSLANSADSGAKSTNGYSAGSNFGSGFCSGIVSWVGSAVSAAASLAASALSAIKRTLDIHSPSKETGYLARMAVKGFTNQLEEGADDAERAGNILSKSALEGLDISGLVARMREVVSSEKSRLGGAISVRVNRKVTTEYEDANNQEEFMDRLAVKISDEFVSAFARAGLTVTMDKKVVGKIITPEVDKNLRVRKV